MESLCLVEYPQVHPTNPIYSTQSSAERPGSDRTPSNSRSSATLVSRRQKFDPRRSRRPSDWRGLSILSIILFFPTGQCSSHSFSPISSQCVSFRYLCLRLRRQSTDPISKWLHQRVSDIEQTCPRSVYHLHSTWHRSDRRHTLRSRCMAEIKWINNTFEHFSLLFFSKSRICLLWTINWITCFGRQSCFFSLGEYEFSLRTKCSSRNLKKRRRIDSYLISMLRRWSR